jgi:hypothetical protein
MRAELRTLRRGICMRTLLISALAASLIGCACLAPPEASFKGCTDANGFACFDETAGGPQIKPKPAASKADPVARPVKTIAAENSSSAQFGNKADPLKKEAKSKIAAKMEAPESSQLGDEADPATKKVKSKIAAKMEAPASAHLGGEADPVLKRAKSTIAAKMEDSSAEFSEMKRAVRKNTLGKPIDTICGYVKGKSASGGDTGERPFLYLVQEDEAYIVDGSRDMTAATAYRNICN